MAKITGKVSFALLLTLLLISVVPRAMFFAVPPGWAEDFIGEILRIQFHVFLTIIGGLYLYAVQEHTLLWIAALLLIILVVRIFVYARHGRALLPPEASVFLSAGMVLLQFFFDMSFRLMLAALLASAGAAVAYGLRRVAPSALVLIAPPVILLLLCIPLDGSERAGLFLLLPAWFALAHLHRHRRIDSLAALTLLLVAIPVLQLFSSWMPALGNYKDARQFSKLLALSFCESKNPPAVYAVHPQCPLTMFAHKCRDAFIGVYDAEQLALRREIRVFNQDYFGRPEQLICHDQKLFVGMNGMRINGETVGANTMLVDLADGRLRTWKNFAGPGIGNSLAYDAQNDALFLTAEFDQRIYRWDFKAGTMNTALGDALPNPWYRLLAGRMQSGSLISHHDALSRRHNAVYFAEWINGRYIHEVDLTTLKPKRRFRFNGGASVGVTVDEKTDRLWVSHLWGFSVFDLKTGMLVSKVRAGFINRPAVIDETNDLVFAGATAQGRIHVFDRMTSEPLSRIALGIGSRYLLISPGKHRLYAASSSGSYAFDLDPTGAFVQSLIRHRTAVK